MQRAVKRGTASVMTRFSNVRAFQTYKPSLPDEDYSSWDLLPKVPTTELLKNLHALSKSRPLFTDKFAVRKGARIATPPVKGLKYDPAESFMALYSRSRKESTLIPPIILASVALYAHDYEFETVFRIVAEYVNNFPSDVHAKLDSTQRQALDRLIRSLLLLCAQHMEGRAQFVTPLLMRLFNFSLEPNKDPDEPKTILKSLPPVVLTALSRYVCSQSDIEPYVSLMEMLFRVISESVTPPAVSSKETRGNWTLYRMVATLIGQGYRDAALPLFGELVNQNRLPLSTINAAQSIIHREGSQPGLPEEFFDIVMLGTLTRACQLSEWTDRTIIMTHTLISRCGSGVHPDVLELLGSTVRDVILRLIHSKLPNTINGAVSLIKHYSEHHHLPLLPNTIIQQIYASLDELKMPDEMSKLFLCLHAANQGRSEESRLSRESLPGPSTISIDYDAPKDIYNPPRGGPRRTLMTFYSKRSKAGVRALADEIITELKKFAESADIFYIGETIYTLAEAGLRNEALHIWRGMEGVRGSELLYGNAKAALKMVKVFVAASETAKSKMAVAATKRSAGKNNAIRVSSTTDDTPEAPDEDFLASSPPSDPSIEEYGDTDQVARTTLPETDEGLNLLPDENTETFPTRRSLADAAKEYRDIAALIAADFVRFKQPLARASHRDLTSIARISFMIGDLEGAFAAFKALLDRKEIPDEYDINVLLGGMAQYDPRRAALMATRAMNAGLDIDDVGWSTLLNGALRIGDGDLAKILLLNIQSEGTGLNAQTVDLIIRRGLEDELIDDEQKSILLHRGLGLIRHAISMGEIPAPSLGVICIRKALEIKQPKIAHAYWKYVLQPREEFLMSSDAKKLQVGIAGSLRALYYQRREKAGFTPEQGIKWCAEMGVPEVWNRAG